MIKKNVLYYFEKPAFEGLERFWQHEEEGAEKINLLFLSIKAAGKPINIYNVTSEQICPVEKERSDWSEWTFSLNLNDSGGSTA